MLLASFSFSSRSYGTCFGLFCGLIQNFNFHLLDCCIFNITLIFALTSISTCLFLNIFWNIFFIFLYLLIFFIFLENFLYLLEYFLVYCHHYTLVHHHIVIVIIILTFYLFILSLYFHWRHLSLFYVFFCCFSLPTSLLRRLQVRPFPIQLHQ